MDGAFYRSKDGSELERVSVPNTQGSTDMGTLRWAASGKIYRIMYQKEEATEIGRFNKVSPYSQRPLEIVASKNIGGYDCVATPISGDHVRNGFKWINLAFDLVIKREWDMMETDGSWLETRQELTEIQVGSDAGWEQFQIPSNFKIIAPRAR